PRIDVMIISAARDMALVQTALRLGVTHYLIKPFASTALTERLTSYAEMAPRRAALRTVSQHEVDALTATLATTRPANRPTSVTPCTLDTVETLLRESPNVITALDVATRTGLSRATAQRYL